VSCLYPVPAAGSRQTNNEEICGRPVGISRRRDTFFLSYFQIVNVTNGLVLDGNGATTEGSDVLEQTYSGSPTQQWQINSVGKGVYTLANRSSGLVVDGRGLSGDGTPLGQWQYDGSTNLQWAFGPGHSSYKIVNQTTGDVINSGGNVPPGTAATQWLYDGSTNLQWKLIKVN
jgi:alpha-L-fucosidase